MIGTIFIPDDFSFGQIEDGDEMEVDEFQQMIVHQELEINGNLTLEGDLVIIN